MRSSSKKIGLYGASLLAISVSLGAVESRAEAAAVVATQDVVFSVPAGDLGAALTAFARQANQEILFTTSLVSGRRTAGVQGRYAAADALQIILRDTGLEVASRSGSVVTLRLASSDEHEGVPVQLAEVLVQGRPSFNIDVRRTEDDARPYIVFSADEIERSHATTLQEFLSNRLPQASGNDLDVGSKAENLNSRSAIRMRGWGEHDVLMLIDGRPAPLLNIAFSGRGSSDINGIPMSSIERIEVLPASAGGMYGANAVGGVINIILKRDYRGLTVTNTYSNTFETDSGSLRTDLTGGYTFNDGRTRATFSLSRTNGNEILRGDRNWNYLAALKRVSNAPDVVYSAFSPVLGSTPNIRSLDGSNLVLDDGRALGSAFTSVPIGYRAGDPLQGFIDNAGGYNFRVSNDLLGNRALARAVPETYSIGGSVRHQITDAIDGVIDFRHDNNDSVTLLSGNVQNFNLAANAPHNPFQQTIRISVPMDGVSAESRLLSRTTRATVGAIIRLPADWSMAIDYTYTDSEYGLVSSFPLIGEVGLAAIRSGLPGGPGLPALNVLQDPAVAGLDYSPYYLPADSRREGPNTAGSRALTLRLGGDLGTYWGRTLTFTGGAEYETREIGAFISTYLDEYSTPIRPIYSRLDPRYSRATSVFGNLFLPIFPASSELIGDLTVSARYDRYNYRNVSKGSPSYATSPDGPFPPTLYSKSSFDDFNYTVAARFGPSPDLTFRASLATSFNPPSLLDLVLTDEGNGINDYYIDPRRGGATGPRIGTEVPWRVASGGNPHLEPMQATTQSFGLITTPRILPGLRFSVDYVDIVRRGEIGGLLISQMLLYEERFADRITREDRPLTPAEIAAGYTGTPITRFDASYINIAETRRRGVDFQIDYDWSTETLGDFRLYAMASRQLEFTRRVFEDSIAQDGVGYKDSGNIEWRGNGGLEWVNGAYSAGWSFVYVGKYRVYQFGTDPILRDQQIREEGREWVPAETRHDIQAAVNLGDLTNNQWLANTRLAVGIRNVFDTPPEILTTGGVGLGSDWLGRRYSLTLTKSF